MYRRIPKKNWTLHLANVINKARDGDVIVVRSTLMYKLAEHAKERMCPNKNVTFEIEKKA